MGDVRRKKKEGNRVKHRGNIAMKAFSPHAVDEKAGAENRYQQKAELAAEVSPIRAVKRPKDGPEQTAENHWQGKNPIPRLEDDPIQQRINQDVCQQEKVFEEPAKLEDREQSDHLDEYPKLFGVNAPALSGIRDASTHGRDLCSS